MRSRSNISLVHVSEAYQEGRRLVDRLSSPLTITIVYSLAGFLYHTISRASLAALPLYAWGCYCLCFV